jgi:hypothetical protein
MKMLFTSVNTNSPLAQVQLINAVLWLVLALVSCSSVQQPGPQLEQPFGVQLTAAAESVPDGVDSALWAKLTAELDHAVAEAGTEKRVNAAAIGKGSIAPDLSLHMAGGDMLYTWSYRQQGDYDLNGSVTISDLTPIGLHFGKNTLSPDWQQAQLADGDGNGEVNIADVTPIGANFGGRVDGYELQTRPDAGSPFTMMAEYAFIPGSAASGQYPQYTHTGLPMIVGPDFRVVPYVGDGASRQYGVESAYYRSTAGLSAHWYTARGNASRDGRVGANGPSSDVTSWSYDLPAGSAFTLFTEVTSDQYGTIYLPTATESSLAELQPGRMLALNPDGTLKWSYVSNGGSAMSPTASNLGRVVFGDIGGMVYCLAPDGKQLWRRQISGLLLYGSPLLDSLGNVYILSHTLSGTTLTSSTLYRLTPDGAVDWSRALNDLCQSSPFFNSLGNVTVVDEAGELYSFDETGTSAFNFTMPDTPDSSIFTSGICFRDTSVLFSTNTNGIRLNTESNSISAFLDLGGEEPETMPSMNSLDDIIVGTSTTGIDPVYKLNYYDGAIEQWDIDMPGNFLSNIAIDASDRMYISTFLMGDGAPTFGNGISCVLPDQTTAWFHPTGTSIVFTVSLVADNLLVGLAATGITGGTMQLIGIKGP